MTHEITLTEAEVDGLKRILDGTDDILSGVANQLPDDNNESTVDMETRHIEFVAHILDAYDNIYLNDWPDEDEYVDIDLAKDIRSRITD